MTAMTRGPRHILGLGAGLASLTLAPLVLALGGCNDPCADGACEQDETGSESDTSESSTGEEQVGEVFCADVDMDGHADPDTCEEVFPGGDAQPGWLPEEQADDCDDSDANTSPGAAQHDDPEACMQDQDGDGFGNSTPSVEAVTPGQDCEDQDPLFNDCGRWCLDADSDLRGDPGDCEETELGTPQPDGRVANELDCLDDNAAVYTGAAVDEAHLCTVDADSDGFGSGEAQDLYPGADNGSDCNDANGLVVICIETTEVCAQIDPDGEVQLDATLEGGSGGYHYSWEPPEPIDDPEIHNPIAAPDQTTTFTVSVADGHNNSSADTITVHVSGVPWQLDATPGGCDPEPFLEGTPVEFSASGPEGTRICTDSSAGPTAFVCPVVLDEASVQGELEVESLMGGNIIGFVWGWQSPDQYYLLTWKKSSESPPGCTGEVPAGITVKRVDRQATYSLNDFACVQNTDNVQVLLDPSMTTTQGWVENQAYGVTVDHQNGQSVITILDPMMAEIANFTVVDDTYKSGKFGTYVHEQAQACSGDWTSSCDL